MNYQELIERLRYERDDGARDEAANAIESLLAENERLKHNLSTTEQTMREYQELAAKRLEEIERLKEIKMAGEIMRDLLKQRDELLAALDVATENLRSHGDNCFVSEHYEGDPGAMCNCGIDGVTDYLISAIASVKGEQ